MITLLVLKYDPLDPLITYLKDVVQKSFPKALKEAKGKEKVKATQIPEDQEGYVKQESNVRIYVSKYKYVLFLVVDIISYLIVSELLDLWRSISDISRAISYYPKMLSLMIALILVWVGGVYGVLLIIRHFILHVVKDYFGN